MCFFHAHTQKRVQKILKILKYKPIWRGEKIAAE